MAKLPFMKFMPSDFIVDTQTLSLREVGAWVRLLCYIWIHSETGTIRLTDRQVIHLFQDEHDNTFIRTGEGVSEIPLTHALLLFKNMVDANLFDYQIEQERRSLGDENVHVITSRRIEKDKKELKLNANHQKSYKDRVSIESAIYKAKVRDKKSEVRSKYVLKDNTYSASNEASPTGERELTDIQKLIKGWKTLNGYPTEGDESKRWDQAHFKRCSRSVKSLLNLFGSPEAVIECMSYVIGWCQERKLDFTIETVLKRSDLYSEAKNGKLAR